MTALLGRVPIDGKVTDPYPFKVLIGKDNLTANGIQLPDVEGRLSQERQPATGRSPACGAMCKASPSFSATVRFVPFPARLNRPTAAITKPQRRQHRLAVG